MLRIQDAITGLQRRGAPRDGMDGSTPWRQWIAGLCLALLAACGGGGGGTSTTPVTPPVAPTALTVAAGDSSTTLAWGAVSGAVSYNVYRSTTPGSQGARIGTSTTTTYVDSSAVNGATYFYEVTASGAAGEGAASSQSLGVTPAVPVSVPAVPAGLSATAGDAQVTLGWTAVAGASSYNVYRSTSPDSAGAKIGSSATTQFTDTSLSNGSTYYYAVAASTAARAPSPAALLAATA